MAKSFLPSLFGRDRDSLSPLFRDVEKAFDDFSRRSIFGGFTPFGGLPSGMGSPRIDIAESKEAVDVTAELPGVDEKDIDVTVADGMLMIRGEKKAEHDENDKDRNWHITERSYGAFARAIPLPYEPDANKVEAKFDNGVLRVHLPKPAELAKKEKHIAIKKG